MPATPARHLVDLHDRPRPGHWLRHAGPRRCRAERRPLKPARHSNLVVHVLPLDRRRVRRRPLRRDLQQSARRQAAEIPSAVRTAGRSRQQHLLQPRPARRAATRHPPRLRPGLQRLTPCRLPDRGAHRPAGFRPHLVPERPALAGPRLPRRRRCKARRERTWHSPGRRQVVSHAGKWRRYLSGGVRYFRRSLMPRTGAWRQGRRGRRGVRAFPATGLLGAATGTGARRDHPVWRLVPTAGPAQRGQGLWRDEAGVPGSPGTARLPRSGGLDISHVLGDRAPSYLRHKPQGCVARPRGPSPPRQARSVSPGEARRMCLA